MATDHSKIIGSKPIHLTRQKRISPMNSVKSFTRTSQRWGRSFFDRLSLKKEKVPTNPCNKKEKDQPTTLRRKILRQLLKYEPRQFWAPLTENKCWCSSTSQEMDRLRHWPSSESFMQASQIRLKNTLATGHAKQRQLSPNRRHEKRNIFGGLG